MRTDHPTIDLRGYQRLRDLERHVSYSPASIALVLLACVGLAVLGYGQYLTFHTPDSGFGILLGGFGLTAGSFCGIIGYLKWRLSRLKCPHCDGEMRRYLVDLPDDFRFPGYAIDGRRYCQPFGDDHEVRLMKVVRACAPCRTYVDGLELHQETCQEDDLERIRSRLPNHERDTRRRETWGKVLAVLWGAFLLLAFLLLWWSSL